MSLSFSKFNQNSQDLIWDQSTDGIWKGKPFWGSCCPSPVRDVKGRCQTQVSSTSDIMAALCSTSRSFWAKLGLESSALECSVHVKQPSNHANDLCKQPSNHSTDVLFPVFLEDPNFSLTDGRSLKLEDQSVTPSSFGDFIDFNSERMDLARRATEPVSFFDLPQLITTESKDQFFKSEDEFHLEDKENVLDPNMITCERVIKHEPVIKSEPITNECDIKTEDFINQDCLHQMDLGPLNPITDATNALFHATPVINQNLTPKQKASLKLSRKEFRETVGKEFYQDLTSGKYCYKEIIQIYQQRYPEYAHKFTENFCSKTRCGRIMNPLTGLQKRRVRTGDRKMKRIPFKSPNKSWQRMTSELFQQMLQYEADNPGCKQSELEEIFKVNRSTFYRWKRRYQIKNPQSQFQNENCPAELIINL